MRIGTFWCWLFGHKFLHKGFRYPEHRPNIKEVFIEQSDFCIRCGKDRLQANR